MTFSGGPAQGEAGRLALVPALDVSIPVGAAGDRLRRPGIAAAPMSREGARAFFAAPDSVALHGFERSSHRHRELRFGRGRMRTPDDRIAAALARSRRGRSDMPTGIGTAPGPMPTVPRQTGTSTQ